MATAHGLLLALGSLLLAMQATAASAGGAEADGLDALALEIARRRQASKALKA